MLAFLVLAQRRADAVPYDVNLILHGNAESGSNSATGDPVLIVPNWTKSSAFTVIPYNAPNGYPTSGGPGPSDRLNQFFAEGNNAAVSTATQEIDLSANASDINQGQPYLRSLRLLRRILVG